VTGIGCYFGLIDGGYGVIEENKTPEAAGVWGEQDTNNSNVVNRCFLVGNHYY